MTRRELLDLARLALLRLRVTIARPLPVALMALLAQLDEWAKRLGPDGVRVPPSEPSGRSAEREARP